MGKKVITIGLSEKDIDRAIKEIKQYKKEMLSKMDKYRSRLAEEIAKEAETGFSGSIVDDIIKGGSPHNAEVSVSFTDNGNIAVIVANGADAVWCEFGSGVYHNGSAGSSPNPYGVKLGYTIGSFGEGKGQQTVWGFYENDKAREAKEVTLTHGTPATMPMYRALLSVANRSIAIAREVFG